MIVTANYASFCSITRKMLRFAALCLCVIGAMPQPEVAAPGPASGIVLREQPGLLITNCKTYTQKVYVRLDPRDVYRVHTLPVAQTSWAGARWTREVLAHAQADVNHMLHQLQKLTVTQADLSGYNRRPKRFLGALLGAAAAVGTLFNIGMNTANAVNLATVRRHVGEIQAEMPEIRQQLLVQSHALQTFGKSLNGTITVLNTHSSLLNQTIKSINKLFSVVQGDLAQTQLLTMLMADMLREVSSSIDSLAMGRIPHYLIPLSLVQNILTSATMGPTSPIQTHLAFSLGSAIPLYVDPEAGDLAFLLSLPIIDANNIYRLKDVVNVGFWQGNTYVKIHTPEVVAYHDSNEQLYLAPNLKMCTLTKDIHFLCPSKPFIRDNTEGICGLEAMRPYASCPAEATPRSQVEVTQAEIVGNQWLVNTPARTATLTYDQHDTATRISLPNQTLWITVPKGSILHIDELALYHLTDDEYQAEIEISPFFKQHSFVLDPELEERIKEEGTQLIDLTPVNTALEAIARLPPAGAPIIRAWSAADTALCISTIVGYVVTLTLAFLLHKRVNVVQESLNKCTSGVPRLFRRDNLDQESEPENVTDLIEILPIPSRQNPDN